MPKTGAQLHRTSKALWVEVVVSADKFGALREPDRRRVAVRLSSTTEG
jgi:hypothetical protein